MDQNQIDALVISAKSAWNFYQQNKESINERWNTFKNLFNWDKDQIIVVGLGGTGKTTLSLFLSGQKEKITGEYELSQNVDTFKIEGTKKKLIVLPGQKILAGDGELLTSDIWANTLGKMRDKGEGVIGLINVVSFGYHTTTLPIHSVIQNPPKDIQKLSVDEIFSIYAKENRQKEIDLLNKIKPFIESAHEKKICMLTVINKLDIFFDEKEQKDVLHYYMEDREDSYNSVINSLYKTFGSAHFAHQYITATSFIGNLRIGDEIMKKNVSGCDEIVKKASMLKVKKALLDLIEKTK